VVAVVRTLEVVVERVELFNPPITLFLPEPTALLSVAEDLA
jgi:hypothetical protein